MLYAPIVILRAITIVANWPVPRMTSSVAALEAALLIWGVALWITARN
jgi:hypothetical protein